MRRWRKSFAALLAAVMLASVTPAFAESVAAGSGGAGSGKAGGPVTLPMPPGEVRVDVDVSAYDTVYVDPPEDYEFEDGGIGLIGAAFVNNEYFEHGFELPLAGATGWGVSNLTLRQKDDANSKNLGTVRAGVAFEILEEGDAYLRVVVSDGREGWVSKAHTMVNLPDVVPSVVYNAVNSEAAMYRTRGFDLPGVTGKALYDVSRENARLGKTEYDMPVLFGAAVKIAVAQREALVNGDTLVIYETYRPYATQKRVRDALGEVMSNNRSVRDDINGWGKSWFISTGVSNHQRGYAIDVGLAKIQDVEALVVGYYSMNVPGAVVVYEMPTDVHELSTASAALKRAVNSLSADAWKSVEPAETMTDGAKALQSYLVNAGFTPLASEWWHFNDLDARIESGNSGSGGFTLAPNVSKAYDIDIELPLIDTGFYYISVD